jgi:site-specific recombinase XerD
VNLLIDFEEHLRGQGLADRTVAEYCKWARRLNRWCVLHGETLPTLPAHRLRDWIESTVPASRESRKQARTTCMHLYSWLERRDDPWVSIRVPHKRQGKPDPFTDTEASLLRDGAILMGGRAGLATLGLLYTAARPS